MCTLTCIAKFCPGRMAHKLRQSRTIYFAHRRLINRGAATPFLTGYAFYLNG